MGQSAQDGFRLKLETIPNRSKNNNKLGLTSLEDQVHSLEGHRVQSLKNLSPSEINVGSTQFFGYGCIIIISKFDSKVKEISMKTTVDNA